MMKTDFIKLAPNIITNILSFTTDWQQLYAIRLVCKMLKELIDNLLREQLQINIDYSTEATLIGTKSCKTTIKPLTVVTLHQGLEAHILDKTRITIWRNPEPIHALIGHGKKITCIIPIDDLTIASGSKDKTIIIWDISPKKGEAIQILAKHQKTITALAKLSDEILISSSKDKNFKIWNYKTGKCLCTFSSNNKVIRDIKKIPNGNIAALTISTLPKNKILLWRFPRKENHDKREIDFNLQQQLVLR